MHGIRTVNGHRYTVSYPEFTGDGMDTANRFYETLAECAVKYFEEITAGDRCAVCRGIFAVEDDGTVFTVRFTMTLRKAGRRYGEKILEHRWQRWDGKDAVLMR